MVHSLLLSIAVALIMVSTIRFWGRPPRKQRVWTATAIGAGVSIIVMIAGAVVSDQRPTLLFSSVALALMSAWLLKTGHDYTKPSTRRTTIL